MPPLVKLVSKSIGLASEAIADHKERKAAKKDGRAVSPNPLGGSSSLSPSGSTQRGELKHEDDQSSSSDSDDLDGDRAEWALDEAATELQGAPPKYGDVANSRLISSDEAATAFLERHRAEASPKKYQPLPSPVIIPQRRPQNRERGFIRAYAPMLGEYSGIDQKTFIDFLEELDTASKASPVFQVINLACFATGFIPSPIAMGVTMAVQIANQTAQQVQERYRRNTYLDRVNEELFKPRGLYCMIMTFKPDKPSQPFLNMELDPSNMAIMKTLSEPESDWQKKFKQIRLTSGKVKGELSLPEPAPLIYPAIDAAASALLNAPEGSAGAQLPPEKQNSLKTSAAALASYLDRRGQAEYASMYPQSKLAVPPPEKKFASRFSDPNHPANSGTILGLLTGGKFDPKAQKRGHRAQRRAARRGQELSEQDIKNAEMGRLRKMERKQKGPIRRLLHKDVLYLTIVNLPTESEMKEMLQELERMKESQQASGSNPFGRERH